MTMHGLCVSPVRIWRRHLSASTLCDDGPEVCMDVISNFAARYERTREEEYSLEESLEICKKDKTAFASAAERMLQAIGEPQMVDTRNDPRLSRIFTNKAINIHPA